MGPASGTSRFFGSFALPVAVGAGEGAVVAPPVPASPAVAAAVNAVGTPRVAVGSNGTQPMPEK